MNAGPVQSTPPTTATQEVTETDLSSFAAAFTVALSAQESLRNAGDIIESAITVQVNNGFAVLQELDELNELNVELSNAATDSQRAENNGQTTLDVETVNKLKALGIELPGTDNGDGTFTVSTDDVNGLVDQVSIKVASTSRDAEAEQQLGRQLQDNLTSSSAALRNVTDNLNNNIQQFNQI
jgi:hypothetical protein